MSSTIDLNEVEKFSRMADEWWDENGKFKPLHKFNPCRIAFIRSEICKNFKLDEKNLTPFEGLKIVDIGCGGGLISEPFSRMGADILGVDASEKNIAVAKIHAEKSNLKIDYQVKAVEDLVEENAQFDVVLALEIIEHVADVEKFIEIISKLVKPSGMVFVATLNRTLKSLLMAKFGVEYVLRWLPVGTHDWHKFLKPSEIDSIASRHDLFLQKNQGFSYNPILDKWALSADLKINYCQIYKK